MNESENSTATDVVNLILEKGIELFHDEEEVAYAVLKDNGKRVVLVRSEEFLSWISHVVWDEPGWEISLSKSMKEKVIDTLECKAKYDATSKTHKLHLRVGWGDNKTLYYDLGDGLAARIDADGWCVVKNPNIYFRHFPHQRAQTIPARGGNLSDVLNFVNIDRVKNPQLCLLLLTHLVATLVPDVPRAILAVHGIAGSAKSTLFRIVKKLVDPSVLETVTFPRNQAEFAQVLDHHYAVFFDNFTEISDWQSDALCKSVTGDGFSKRKLYSNSEDVTYSYKRSIGLNGVSLIATKPDLLDRSLIFELARISPNKVMTESKLWSKFEAEKPKLLGAMFTALSGAMKALPEMPTSGLPRLADYGQWGCAAAVALGYSAKDFLEAYERNIERQNEEALESSGVAFVLMDYMDDFPPGEEKQRPVSLWFKALKDHAKEHLDGVEFPRTKVWMSRQLKEAKPNLARIGIEVEHVRPDGNRPREILVRKIKGKNKGSKNAVIAGTVGNTVNDPLGTSRDALVSSSSIPALPAPVREFIPGSEDDSLPAEYKAEIQAARAAWGTRESISQQSEPSESQDGKTVGNSVEFKEGDVDADGYKEVKLQSGQ